MLTLVLAVATAVTWPVRALAVTDWDGDGYTDTDCRPLDRAVNPGAVDYPDLAFEDMNCDGIDGDKDGAYFVQPSGSDGNVGTYNAPFATIQKAIDVAKASATKSIYVATGTYNQRLVLPTAADGIRIYGGYDAGLWSRTTSTATTVHGSPDSAALDGATDVVFQLVTLSATNGGGDRSAYGLRAINSSEVALMRVSATAGPGATGTPGTGGSTPIQAADGDAGHTQVAPAGQSACDFAGVGGNTTQPGNGFDGGAGGTGGEETNDGENGVAGSEGGGGSPGGDGGPGGTDLAGDADNPAETENGKTGGTGATGPAGTDGGGGAGDLVNAGTSWAGHDGTNGSSGGPGYGGGGGGGGAGDGAMFAWSTGAGGGQGGDGGAGGGLGTRGSWGGGSFGVYLFNSQAAVSDGSTVQAGTGGTGGAGGAGAVGGAGGDGGPGGVPFDCPSKEGGFGGDGGPGGQGGTGGSGGGGSGGPSIGIFRSATAAATVAARSTVAGGTAGSGGVGPGAAGDGASGQSGAMLPAGGAPTDFDGDGINDSSDACVDIARTSDLDGDGSPDSDGNGDGCPDRAAALPDSDGDGIPDSSDSCPSTAAGASDANGDGCPDTPAGSNPGGETPGGGAPPDVTAPSVSFSVKAQRALKKKALGWSATSNEACSLTVTAKLGKKKLGALKKALAAGVKTALKIKLSRRAQGLLRKALRTRMKVTVTLAWACVDGAGNRRAASKKLIVKR
jgi:hypothetical protein